MSAVPPKPGNRGAFAPTPVGRAYRIFCAAEDWTVITLLAALIGTVSTAIFMRYVLNMPVLWAEMLPRLLLVWMTFLGAARAFRTGDHVSIEVLLLLLRRRDIATRLIDLAMITFFVFIIWIGWSFAAFTWRQSAPPLGLPYAAFVIPIPLFAAIAIIHRLAALAGVQHHAPTAAPLVT